MGPLEEFYMCILEFGGIVFWCLTPWEIKSNGWEAVFRRVLWLQSEQMGLPGVACPFRLCRGKNTCHRPEVVSSVHLLLKVSAGETPLAMEWVWVAKKKKNNQKTNQTKNHENTTWREKSVLNNFKVQRGAKVDSKSGIFLPPPSLLALMLEEREAAWARRRSSTQGNGEQTKRAVSKAGGQPELACIGGWEKLPMKLKTLMVSLGWANNQTSLFGGLRVTEWSLIPYLNKCVQLDSPSRALRVQAPQMETGESGIYLFLDAPF